MRLIYAGLLWVIATTAFGQNWIDAIKYGDSQEAGFRIMNGSSVQYYIYSDNGTHALNIQSTVVSGEADATPRIQLPFTSPNIHLAMSGGNVAIGHNNPLAKLHVSNGDVLLQNSTTGYPRLWLKDVAGTNFLRADYNSLIHEGGDMWVRSGSGYNLILNDGSNGNNVGIGTNSPDSKLSVNGTIHSKEVKVDLNNWPDYVFEKNYQLTSLAELKTYIKKNQHLPEVPSAQEVEKEGVKLGEMNKILLKKMEEMTLYLINQNEVNQKQTDVIRELEERLKKLEEN